MSITSLQKEKDLKRQQRQSQLFGLGLGKTSYGFAFKGYYVANYSIEEMNDSEWSRYLESISKHMNEAKGEHDLSEKEKAMIFIESLKKIELPFRFNDGRIKDILDGSIYTIQELSNYLEEEVELRQ